MPYLVLLLALIVANAAYLAATIGCARLLRLPMQMVSLFNGPSLWTRTHGDCTWELRTLPLGSYVRYDETAFNARSKGSRILLLLAGPIATGLLGTWLSPVGIDDVLHAFWLGSLHPLNRGAESLRHFWTLCQSEAVSAIGAFLLAHAIINLLPTPVSNGGQILVTIVADRQENAVRAAIRWGGVVLVLLLLATWTTALVAAVCR